MGRFRDEIAGTLANRGARALGVALLVPIGLILHAAFDDPRIYHGFHDAERARAIVTDLQKVRAFPARWQASVTWTSASRAKGSAQIQVGPTKWWKTDAPELGVGASTDILLSRSLPGAAIWLKDPPRVVPWKLLGVEFNPEALALAVLFSFAGLTGMVGIRALSGEARESQDDGEAAPEGGILGKLVDGAMTGFLVLLFVLLIVGSLSYAAGFNILEWLGVAP